MGSREAKSGGILFTYVPAPNTGGLLGCGWSVRRGMFSNTEKVRCLKNVVWNHCKPLILRVDMLHVYDGVTWRSQWWHKWTGKMGRTLPTLWSPTTLNPFFLMFIYSFWESVCVREQRRGRERGWERIPGRLHTVSTEPDAGLEPMNHEIWPELKPRVRGWTDWAAQAPPTVHSLKTAAVSHRLR